MKSRRTREHVGARRLVVPLVLTVTVVSAAVAALSSSTGCDDSKPAVDAAVDAAPDTPIV